MTIKEFLVEHMANNNLHACPQCGKDAMNGAVYCSSKCRIMDEQSNEREMGSL